MSELAEADRYNRFSFDENSSTEVDYCRSGELFEVLLRYNTGISTREENTKTNRKSNEKISG